MTNIFLSNVVTAFRGYVPLGSSPTNYVTPDVFFKTNMAGKAFSKVTFGDIPANDVFVCFKVIQRSQVSE